MSGLSDRPVVALPGLLTDASIFRGLPVTDVVEFPAHRPDESLSDYAQRLSFAVPAEPNTILVGYEWGGILALELAKLPKFRTKLSGVLQLCSASEPRFIPSDLRRQARELPHLPDLLLGLMLKGQQNTLARREGLSLDDVEVVDTMADSASLSFYRWAVDAALAWQGVSPDAELPGLPVLRINGDENRYIRAMRGSADYIVKRGGQFAPLTHGDEIVSVADTWAKKLARAA